MSGSIKIKNALISVFSKENLEPIIHGLKKHGVNIFSTGGTQDFIEKLGYEVNRVEDLTTYPSIFGGRVKTLHPKVFGGILARRNFDSDVAELEKFEIPSIDLVIVDLYPFEETVAAGKSEEDIIEKIDIGGISLIRAASKNFKDVLVIPSKDQYGFLQNILDTSEGVTTLEDRKKMGLQGFNVSSNYDTAIFGYFNRAKEVTALKLTASKGSALRYGENPHQKGMFFGDLDQCFEKLNGKELSYNNLLDVDAAVGLIKEFSSKTFAVIKHNNACGIASANTVFEAWTKALQADPVSAFGGILITNSQVDEQTAADINKLFFEILLAPGYDEKALEILKSKQNRIILKLKDFTLPEQIVRTCLNGFLVQDNNLQISEQSEMKAVTKLSPNAYQLADLDFANKVVKHTKSNAIVLVKDQQLLASGTGQTSRVDALRQAIAKAKAFGFSLEGAVMASDAFFPFPDCVEIAASEGIKAVVQPGGSVKDKDSVDMADSKGVAMVVTGIRHFKH